MQHISASRFKDRCLALLDNLDPEGIARPIPATSDCADLIGSMKGKIFVHGNILRTNSFTD